MNFKDHHYLPPDQRPQPAKEEESKQKKVTTTGLRDYNIISNRYLELHNEKIQVDREVERLDAAKKFWDKNDFNPVNGEYYDDQKEDEFRNTRAEEAKTWGAAWVKKLPKTWQEEGALYNPINCVSQDDQRLQEKDQREKNKKKRYEQKYDLEMQIFDKSMKDQDTAERKVLNKVNYDSFVKETGRGYDILTNTQYNQANDPGSKKLFEPRVQKPKPLWVKVQEEAGKEKIEQVEEAKPKKAEEIVAELASKTDTEFWKMNRMKIDRRSGRMMRGSIKGSQAPASSAASNAPIKAIEPIQPTAPTPQEQVFQANASKVLGSQRSHRSQASLPPSKRSSLPPSQYSKKSDIAPVASQRSQAPSQGYVSKRASSHLSRATSNNKSSIGSQRIRTSAFQKIAA